MYNDKYFLDIGKRRRNRIEKKEEKVGGFK